jgi:Asp-tRNA(Asn)/Glu-tRNA(Gln) amidotransferase A subunit family amidase
VVGLKPTCGLVSRTGVISMSSTLDHVGPLARTVLDCALMLNVVAGYDPLDRMSIDAGYREYVSGIEAGVDGLRVGLELDRFDDPRLPPDARKAAERAAAELNALGADVIDVSIPAIDLLEPAFFAILPVDLSAYHRQWLRQRRDKYSAPLRQMLEFGELVPGAHYLTGQRVRLMICDAFRETFVRSRLDALMTLAPGGPAAPIEEASASTTLFDFPLREAAGNMTGLPVLSMPCGFNSHDLPVAFELYGRPFDEQTLLRIGRAYEHAHPVHHKIPGVAAAVQPKT